MANGYTSHTSEAPPSRRGSREGGNTDFSSLPTTTLSAEDQERFEQTQTSAQEMLTEATASLSSVLGQGRTLPDGQRLPRADEGCQFGIDMPYHEHWEWRIVIDADAYQALVAPGDKWEREYGDSNFVSQFEEGDRTPSASVHMSGFWVTAQFFEYTRRLELNARLDC